MSLKLKAILIALALSLSASSAYAECSGQPGAGTLCGNPTASQTLPSWANMSTFLDRNFGAPSTHGTVLNRGSSLWSATAAPSLGLNGTAGGSLTLQGATSGSTMLSVASTTGAGGLFQLPSTSGSNTFILQTDGAGHTSWVAPSAGGTVTSVGLALPGSVFSISGSPVTTTGTLTGAFVNQNANTVFAGPTSGGQNTPAFRALVGADLPNPSASTLGGIESIAATSHQWINAISTSGVPSQTQPAFSDISGSITAAQCVAPTLSTIGCVEAIAPVTSNWINSISTLGIPALSQPSFTDINGNATLAQLPSISNNSVLGNNSGGTAVPSTLTASNVLDFIATTQGDVLYRNGTTWVALAPGTNGQVLTTGGAAANPSWSTVTGTGTVTNVATSGGLTGGPIMTTGTLSLASIATGNVLAYTGGGSGTPVATTPSAVLDVIGSSTGSILYRAAGGTGWQALAAGSNGQVLTMGASTPSWSSAGTVSNVTITASTGLAETGTCNISTTGTCTLTGSVPPPAGRLTLQANTPVMITSQVNSATLRYDCYVGNQVPYYNGSIDQLDTITSCEVTDAMVSAASAGQVVGGQVYDVWWVHGGTNRICLAMSSSTGGGGGWASDGGSTTSRGTGFTVLDRTTRPYITNKNALANCFNGATNYGSVSANQGTYLGTVIASGNGQISYIFGTITSSAGQAVFGVWNMYNRRPVASMTGSTGSSANYTTANTWRQAFGSSTMNAQYVVGLSEDAVSAQYNAYAIALGSVNCDSGIGVDSTAAFSGSAGITSASSTATAIPASFAGYPGVGLHTLYAIEAVSSAAGCSFYGSGSLPLFFQTALTVNLVL
jgi:hypothetical protein